MKILSSCLLAITLVLLSACSSENNPALLTASGVVINDVAVAGALVCIDVNENLRCDDDEPSTTTDANGAFEFQYSSNYNNRNIVVDGEAGEEEATASVQGLSAVKNNITSAPPGLFLTAPNSASVVSPLTTLFAVRAKLMGVSLGVAQAQVVAQLGLPAGTDLNNFNYVSPNNPAVAAIASAVTELITANRDVIGNAGTNATARIALAVNDLFTLGENGKSRIESIVASVREGAEGQDNTISADDVESKLQQTEYELNPIGGRYVPIEDGSIIRDTVTYLEWQRCSVGQTWNATTSTCDNTATPYTWGDAIELTAEGGFVLPSKEQLRTLVYCSDTQAYDSDGTDSACGADAGSPTINQQAFPGTPGSWFWSSSPSAFSTTYPWLVNFSNGFVYWNYWVSSDQVRLVRQGLIDGRFLPIEDGSVVRDTVTNLEWQRCSLGQTWNATTSTCDGTASAHTWDNATGLTAEGDFVLPNKEQLRTLVYCSDTQQYDSNGTDDSCAAGANSPTINQQAFPGTPGHWFWSSSPYASNTFSAWGVFFSNGNVYWNNKVSFSRVRLVRAGQSLGDLTVTYTATVGGSIEGESEQTVSVGGDASTVTAVADSGYQFVRWDDGIETAARTDTNLQEGLTVEAQFELNQYTLTFDSAGGSAVDQITLDFGLAVDAPANPTRTGYTFTSWSPAVPATMPAEDRTLAAQWTVNQYTLTFDSADGSAVESITQAFDSAVTAPASPTRTGYTFTAWSPAVPATMPAEDQTLAAQWTVNQYTLTFDSAGGSAVDQITLDFGLAVDAPANPTRTGYTFTAWSPAVPATMPAEDRTLAAQWTILQYNLTYSAGTGGAVTGTANQTVDHGSDGTVVTASPSFGYSFEQWTEDTNTSASRTDTNVTADATYTATFTLNAAAPTNVAAVAGDGSVTVSWDPVVGATSYNLYYAEESGFDVANYATYTGGTMVTDVTSPHEVASLTNGTTYYFRVTAVSAQGEGIPSAQVAATPEAPTAAATLALSANGAITAALKEGGSVWVWSDNSFGTMGYVPGGLGDDCDGFGGCYNYTPTQISGLTGVTAVAAGYSHIIALKEDGSVWAWGRSEYGALGYDPDTSTDAFVTNWMLEDEHYNPTPQQVAGLPAITAISAGFDFNLALASDGTVWAWGDNLQGQLGDNSTIQRNAPVQVVGSGGEGTLGTVAAIAAGAGSSYAVLNDGTLWAWGDNGAGQLGIGNELNQSAPTHVTALIDVAAVKGSSAFALALKNDGTVWSFGDNFAGQLGNGTTTESSIPVQVSGLTDVTEIAAGFMSGFALKGDVSAWAWGANNVAQLGDGSLTDRTAPVAITVTTDITALVSGDFATAALKSDGTVHMWGGNHFGQLGHEPGTNGDVDGGGGDWYAPAAVQVDFAP